MKFSIFKKNHLQIKFVVGIYITLHILFFLSGFIPEKKNFNTTAFRVPIELSKQKSLSLIRWDYCPEEGIMEVEIDIYDKSYTEGTLSLYSLYEDEEELETKIVFDKDGTMVLQLYGIPNKKDKLVSIHYNYESNEVNNNVILVHYTTTANIVSHLPVLDEKGYLIKRTEYDIAYYQELISNLENQIEENQKLIQSIEKENETLRNNKNNLTTDELLNLNTTLENNNSNILSLKSSNEDYHSEILNYQENINVLQERKKQYE